MCNSNDTFDKNKKYGSRYWGSTAKTGSLLGIKQTKSNPKVNRGCAPLTANRTSADCVQISLGPSIPYIPLGVHHTGRFNAMKFRNVFLHEGYIFIHISLLPRVLPLVRIMVWYRTVANILLTHICVTSLGIDELS